MFGYREQNQYSRPNVATKPSQQLMSFHNYVKTVLTNNTDEITACAKYKEFLASLTQSKVCRFFDANRDLEWFRLKYHPTESQRYLQQQSQNLLNRLKLFNQLNERRCFDNLALNAKNTKHILNLMDAIIVHLESGPNELFEQLLSPQLPHIDYTLREQYIPTHPTTIVIHDLPIETTIADIQELCIQANPDLLRLTSLDPYYVKGGQLRRKFVAIYKTNVDIKNVCWLLTRMKHNNQQLKVTIDKCLRTRVLQVDPINNHPVCVLNDIRKAILLIIVFDEFRGLHGKRKQLLESVLAMQDLDTNVTVKMEVDSSRQNSSSVQPDDVAPLSPPGSVKSANEDEEDKNFDISTLDEDREKEKKKLFDFKFSTDLSNYRIASKLSKSKNPVIDKAGDYLIDFVESTQAKYYLTKVNPQLLADATDCDLDKLIEDKYTLIDSAINNLHGSIDENTKLLDKMLWYLRIVHSFDYYNKSLYKNEDELTLRMGAIHVRSDDQGVTYDAETIRSHLLKSDKDYEAFEASQIQTFITKDEERFNYKSYGKVITDELTSYAQKIQKAPRPDEFEEVYKCKHCTRVFQKLNDIGRHFVSKHRWAIDAIELETDFFNTYLFDNNKINPCPSKDLLETRPNKFMNTAFFSQMGEDPDLLKQTMDEYKKMESFVWEPAPRAQIESDPRNESVVDYTDISFDDAI